ncbi:LacI family transcriptional regulator [Thalassobius sp. Cn5-15]|uniref:LacI family transcriptional regulator n=1 Tax=Thalassobius sp. Cn5-15 TaxID=2917763 RepID=UPI001EF2D17F|nr:LacI family transcriptional regulator [Thalassobius sp. Cn5-15]MCG7495060.1 LacI family transcriptional regulator [Thalassobius sp. Cn5-15]
MKQFKAQKPTQRRIAELSGLSIGAVSRALANDPKIKQETREAIKKIADEIGYAPDRAAQRLRTGKTKVINLILPPHEEIFGFGTSLIRGISRELEDTGYKLVVMPDFGIDGEHEAITRIVRNQLADGILFSRTEPNDPRVKYLSEAQFPFVAHGRTELATPHPYVDYDNFEFSYQAAQRLIKMGAVKLCILLPPPTLMFRQHLLHGFMTAVRESGVQFEILEGATLDSSPELIKSTIETRFSSDDRPDGLILPGEVSGLAAMAAMDDIGLSTVYDVKLVVKQTTGLFNLVRPRVESIFEDLPVAGRHMAQLLLKRIEGEDPSNLQVLQPISEAPGD